MKEIANIIFICGFLFLAAIFVLTIIALPTVVAFFLNRWLSRKGVKYVGLILLIAAPIWTGYEVYTAVFPRDDFYFSEFKEITLREAPKSAKIIRKDASYPDFHGDYCSASLIIVSAEDYLALLNDLSDDKRITKIKSREIIGSSELDKVLGSIRTEQIVQSFTRSIIGEEDHYLYIGFLDDKKTIVISVCIT